MKGKKKDKKNKVRYIDDGSTVYDMSGVTGKQKRTSGKAAKDTSGKTAFQTYKESVKMMFVPMLITLAGIAAIFLIIWIILTVAEVLYY